MKYNNHLSVGNSVIKHKNYDVVTSLNSTEFETFLENLPNYPYKVGYIPPGYEHRADLISDLFYNTPVYDWLICLFNNIDDPFQQLNVQDRILIPELS